MRRKFLYTFAFSMSVTSLLFTPNFAWATDSSSSLNENGKVIVQGSEVTKPLDPENPGNEVNPGEGPSTEGTLRIDYVSSLNFGNAKITKTNRVYKGQAQLFLDETEARGNYIQITDQRTESTGWSLQVKQEYQFRDETTQENQELAGAVLSLDNGWANSVSDSGKPNVQRDTISLDAIGNAYQVASATSGSGSGVWLISFGASDTNSAGQPNTLSPLTDEKGNPVMDAIYNKQAYSNSAITLSVPDSTVIRQAEYQTKLTWILQTVPDGK